MTRSGTGAIPRMIRGSVVVQRRRCGKANCRCTDGESLHEATVLSYSEGGRNRTVMLAAEDVAAVTAAVVGATGPPRPSWRRRATRDWPRCCRGPRPGAGGDRVDGAAAPGSRRVHRTGLRDLHRPAHRLGAGAGAAHHHRDDRGGRPMADPAGRRAHDAYHRFIRDGVWSMSRLW